jgi:hypothetical protein
MTVIVKGETRITCTDHETMTGMIVGEIEMTVVICGTGKGNVIETVTLIVDTTIETAILIVAGLRTGDASEVVALTGHPGTMIGEGEIGMMNGRRTTTDGAARMAPAGAAVAGVPARRVLSAG